MEFAHPIGLFALAALPAIAALYWFRRRFQRRVVAGLFLWAPEGREDVPGRRWQRLQRSANLLLELLAALALALLVAGLRPASPSPAAHYVAVLDDSASMGAVGGDGMSVRDRAVRSMNEAWAGFGGAPLRVTLVLSGERPAVLAGPAATVEEARRRLADWRPMQVRHPVQPALDLAAEFVGPGARVALFTDRLDHAPTKGGVEVRALGQPVDNVALVGAERLEGDGPGLHELFVAVRNFGSATATRLNVAASDADGGAAIPVLNHPLQLDADEERLLRFQVPSAPELYEVSLPQDALAVDNVARLLPPRSRRVAVLDLLPEGRAGDRARLAAESVGDVVWTDDPDAAHVVLATPESAYETPAPFRLGLDVGGTAEADDLVALIGPFVWERDHPLLAGMRFDGAVWAARRSPPAWPGASPPLVSVGDLPLAVQVHRKQGTAFLLNLDLARSNLHRLPDWPILFSNLMALAREAAPGATRPNARLGETVRFNVPAGAEGDLTLHLGDDKRPMARRADAAIVRPEAGPGVYEVRDGSDRALGRMAVNFFDARESDLRGAESASIEAVGVGLGTVVDRRAPWTETALALAALAALLGDWALLNRSRSTLSPREGRSPFSPREGGAAACG